MGLRPDVSCQEDPVIPNEPIVGEILVETAFHSDPYNCYIHFRHAYDDLYDAALAKMCTNVSDRSFVT